MGLLFNCQYKQFDGTDMYCGVCGGTPITRNLNDKCCRKVDGYKYCGYYDAWKCSGGSDTFGKVNNPLITGKSCLDNINPFIAGQGESAFYDVPNFPYTNLSSKEMGCLLKGTCLVYLIGMPIALLYMSVTDPSFGIPLFGAVIIGCILTLAFTLKEIVFKKILLSVWGFASVIFLIYNFLVNHYILKLIQSDTDIFVNIVIGPLFCLMHSAIFAWVIYAVLAKRAAKNPDVLPLSKSLKIVLLLLIPLAVSVMYMQFNKDLEEEKQYYAEDEYYSTQAASVGQSSSGNDDYVIQPVTLQSGSSETNASRTESESNSSASSDSNILTLEIISGDGSSSANTNVQSANTGSSPDVGIFNIGDHGYVCRTDGVNLRREPNLDSSGVIKVISYQSAFTVVGGPSVDSNTIWWQVTMDDGSTGWMSEGHDVWNSDYLLCVK